MHLLHRDKMLSVYIIMTTNFLYDINRNIVMEYGKLMLSPSFQINKHFWKVKKYLKILNAYRKYFH